MIFLGARDGVRFPKSSQRTGQYSDAASGVLGFKEKAVSRRQEKRWRGDW